MTAWELKSLAAAVLLAVAGGTGFYFGAGQVQQKWDRERAGQAVATQSAEQAARAKEGKLAVAVATIDKQHKELANAQVQNDDLRRQLATGSIRVRIPAHCPTPGVPATAGAPGVDDGTATAELDQAFAEALVGISSDGDRAIRKLNAAQDYIEQVTAATQ